MAGVAPVVGGKRPHYFSGVLLHARQSGSTKGRNVLVRQVTQGGFGMADIYTVSYVMCAGVYGYTVMFFDNKINLFELFVIKKIS